MAAATPEAENGVAGGASERVAGERPRSSVGQIVGLLGAHQIGVVALDIGGGESRHDLREIHASRVGAQVQSRSAVSVA